MQKENRSAYRKLICIAGLWLGLTSSSFAAPEAACVLGKCGLPILQCVVGKECRDWMGCVQECGDDMMKCPSVCGFYYQSRKIDKVSQCIFTNNCVELEFEKFPPYIPSGAELETLEGVEGIYWFGASHGGDHIFDFSCQRFEFAPTHPGEHQVHFSVPITLHEDTRLTSSIGTFSQNPSGSILVKYDNFTGYHENWYVSKRTQNTITAQVCFRGESSCYDYGTIILTKTPFPLIDTEEMNELETSLEQSHALKFEDFGLSSIADCD